MILIHEIPDRRKFKPGQLVRHRRYHYRGVVVSSDPRCKASDQWYQANQTQPQRQRPWYHVLVHDATHTTYAAEENLEPDPEPGPIRHPLLKHFFSGYKNGWYIRNNRPWPV